MKMKKMLAVLTVLTMILSLFPLQVLAEDWGDYKITQEELKPGSELPNELNGETLDLNEYDLTDLKEVMTIRVSGENTVIGTPAQIKKLIFSLTDESKLISDGLSLSGQSKILVEDNAAAVVALENSVTTLTSSGSGNFAVKIGETGKLTVTGSAGLNLKGDIIGSAIRFENVSVSMNPKKIQVNDVEIINSTIAQGGESIGDKNGTIQIVDSTVKVSSLYGDVHVSGNSDVQLSYGSGITGNVAMDAGLLQTNGVLGNVIVNNGSVESTGTITGDVTVNAGELYVKGAANKTAVVGDVEVAGGAKALLYSGFSGMSNVAAVTGSVLVEDGANFAAIAVGDEIVTGGELVGDSEILLGSLKEASKTEDATIVINGSNQLICDIPAYYKSFAVAVPRAEAYSITDLFETKMLVNDEEATEPYALKLGEVNSGLFWKSTGTVSKYFIDGGNIQIFSEEGVSKVSYNGTTRELEDNRITIDQMRKSTANRVIIGEGVKDLTLVLNNVHISIPTKGSPVEIGKDSEVTVEFEGNNVLEAGTRSAAIDVFGGADVTIKGAENAVLTAQGGGNAAGIGCGTGIGGSRVDSGSRRVAVVSGTVEATGGSGGAGIGTGQHCGDNINMDIEISGTANVTAIGNGTPEGGAGIGAGGGSNIGTIVIKDNAVVMAKGYADAAGIGGGQYVAGEIMNGGTFEKIRIEGSADVTAIGGVRAAGIGNGGQGSNNVRRISGGVIEIQDGAVVRAFAAGIPESEASKFAIDTDADEWNIPTAMLNCRFDEEQLGSFHASPVDAIDRLLVVSQKNENNSIELEVPSVAYTPYESFACTVALDAGSDTTIFNVKNVSGRVAEKEAACLITGENKDFNFAADASLQLGDEYDFIKWGANPGGSDEKKDQTPGGGGSRPRPNRPDGPNTPDEPVVIPEDEIPAGMLPGEEETELPADEVTGEVIMEDEQIPAGELPKTGGLDAGILYGLGALLVGSGFVLRRKK